MAVDLKAELTRPLALILMSLAALGWVLFVLSSWSAASTQKAQRMRLVEMTEKRDKLSADLARQLEVSGSLADLQTKLASTQQDLARATQTRADVQADLSTAQRNLSTARRDLTEADRTLQSQTQKLADVQSNADASPASEAEPQQVSTGRRGGRRASRRRRSRSFSVVNRTR